jgi:anti-sigma B factor antagonist
MKKIIILSATMLFIAGSAFAQAELTIRQREVDGVTILDLNGKITDGGGTAALRNAIRGLLNQGQRKFVLNFEKASVDENGIGEMIASHEAIKAQGGQLKMVKLPKSLLDLLAISKLATVFDIYDDEAEALSTFSQR